MATTGLSAIDGVDLEHLSPQGSKGGPPRLQELQGGTKDLAVQVATDRNGSNRGMGGDSPAAPVYVHRSNSNNVVGRTFADDAEQQHDSAAAAGAAASGRRRGWRRAPLLQGLGAAKRKINPCFRLSRWPLLVLFCLHALFVGPHYLNWAPLRQCLLYWGVYEWLCDPAEQPQQQRQLAGAGAGSSSSSPDAFAEFDLGVSSTEAFEPPFLPPGAGRGPNAALAATVAAGEEPKGHGGFSRQATCKAQEIAIARLFGIATASDFGVSFIGGLLLDAWGPKAASSLGTLSMLFGWLLITFSSASVSLYILGFIFYGIGVDAAFYGVISLPLLFARHEGLVMTILMSFRCLAWGTPVVLERLAAPETFGLSAHAVLLGVQCSTLAAGVLIAVLFIPMKPFQRPAFQGASGGPLHHQPGAGPKDQFATDQHIIAAGTATAAVTHNDPAAAAPAAAAEEAQAEAAVTAAAAAAGTAVLPQTLRAPIAEETADDPEGEQRQQHADVAAGGLKETTEGDLTQGLACRSLRTMSSLSAVAAPEGASGGRGSLDHSGAATENQQQGQQQQQAAIFISPFPGGLPSPLSSPSKRRRRGAATTTGPRIFGAFRSGLHACYVKSRLFTLDYLLSGAFFPVMPYFALTLLRGVYFGESSEYLVPQAMRALHILLGLVFIYPPVLGFIADRGGVGLCLFLVNTLGALLMGLSLLQYSVQNTALAYIISFCYAAYAPLMSGQVYLYMLQAFPAEHLGKLLGLAMTVGGFFSLIATPLFELSVHRNSNFVAVLSVLLFLSFLAYGLIFWAVRAANKRNTTTDATNPQSA